MKSLCPCQSNKSYAQCCGVYIENKIPAPHPEILMRSRYTAYTLANIDYIQATQSSFLESHFAYDDALQWSKRCKWMGLEVHRSWIDESNPARGYVEFTAHFKENGKKNQIHEISEFHQRAGRWYYLIKIPG